jgi:hypothetical protein
MLCTIYKSPKKDQTYLYVLKRDDFSALPAALLQTFGQPVFVTVLDLASRDRLAGADIEKVRLQLQQQGFYLQMPPQSEDWLAEHKAWQASQPPVA